MHQQRASYWKAADALYLPERRTQVEGRNKHTVDVSATLQEALYLIRHDVLDLLSLPKEPNLSSHDITKG